MPIPGSCQILNTPNPAFVSIGVVGPNGMFSIVWQGPRGCPLMAQIGMMMSRGWCRNLPPPVRPGCF
ncbi:MAG: hypothetical protein HC902_10640 [Calothrix sp. SM1_5_4]|nr:hypothetical protein [Calothrix sp. SM1_5_4]